MGEAVSWGLPYMGSKNAIAQDIVDALPPGETFVDLFAGGGAITHAAMASGKYKRFIANDISDAPSLFVDAVRGKFADEKRWISREDFFALKDAEPYVRLCWSFGNRGACYLYSREVEPWKKAYWCAVMHGYTSLFAAFGIHPPRSRERLVLKRWIEANYAECKEKYTAWYIKNVLRMSEREAQIVALEGKLKATNDELREYLRGALDKSGLTQKEIDRRLGTNGMAGHYFGKSQWEFPTLEAYQKLRQWLDLPRDYFECVNPLAEALESLESLESLRHLERLQNLERFRSFKPLEVVRGDYRDVEIPRGAVVYCDIPYRGTETYLGAEEFSHDDFYRWALSRPFDVYISEYDMPAQFARVFECPKRSLLANGGAGRRMIEKLFCTRHGARTRERWGQALLFEPDEIYTAV